LPQLELSQLEKRVTAHIDDYRKHVEEEHERWDNLITVQENNNAAIKELTVAVASQVESSKDVIEAYAAVNGAYKVGRVVSQFLIWLSGFTFVGVGASWILDKLST
jgi:GTPase